ncbi:MAG: hypothetical protein K6G30_06590 [Acetatifactor sp.]|nr:hypothetical protein [Acetatifactor sp.]
MEKVINRLYEIEEKANSIVEGTAGKKAVLYEEYQKKLSALDAKMEEATKEELNKLREKMNAEVDTEHKMLGGSLEDKLTQLESNYEKNHDKLVASIVERITGV